MLLLVSSQSHQVQAAVLTCSGVLLLVSSQSHQVQAAVLTCSGAPPWPPETDPSGPRLTLHSVFDLHWVCNANRQLPLHQAHSQCSCRHSAPTRECTSSGQLQGDVPECPPG